MGRQPWPNEKSAKAFALRLDGWSFAEIARELQTTRSAVSGFMARHGVSVVDDDAPAPVIKHYPRPDREFGRAPGSEGTFPFEIPARRENDCTLHLTLLLASLQEARAAA